MRMIIFKHKLHNLVVFFALFCIKYLLWSPVFLILDNDFNLTFMHPRFKLCKWNETMTKWKYAQIPLSWPPIHLATWFSGRNTCSPTALLGGLQSKRKRLLQVRCSLNSSTMQLSPHPWCHCWCHCKLSNDKTSRSTFLPGMWVRL